MGAFPCCCSPHVAFHGVTSIGGHSDANSAMVVSYLTVRVGDREPHEPVSSSGVPITRWLLDVRAYGDHGHEPTNDHQWYPDGQSCLHA